MVAYPYGVINSVLHKRSVKVLTGATRTICGHRLLIPELHQRTGGRTFDGPDRSHDDTCSGLQECLRETDRLGSLQHYFAEMAGGEANEECT